jgi:hypothetical protein
MQDGTGRISWWAVGALGLAVALAPPARGHDYWIDVEPMPPPGDRPAAVRIAGGHYFPSSSVVLAERLIAELVVRDPDGVVTPLVSAPREKAREAAWSFDRPGLYRFRLAIRRPLLAEPEYWATALVAAGSGGTDDPDAYAVGRGLEIVPAKPVSSLAVGAPWPVRVLLDGVPVAARVVVIPAWGKTRALSGAAGESVFLPLPVRGRYLVTATVDARTASLMFFVPDRP